MKRITLMVYVMCVVSSTHAHSQELNLHQYFKSIDLSTMFPYYPAPEKFYRIFVNVDKPLIFVNTVILQKRNKLWEGVNTGTSKKSPVSQYLADIKAFENLVDGSRVAVMGLGSYYQKNQTRNMRILSLRLDNNFEEKDTIHVKFKIMALFENSSFQPEIYFSNSYHLMRNCKILFFKNWFHYGSTPEAYGNKEIVDVDIKLIADEKSKQFKWIHIVVPKSGLMAGCVLSHQLFFETPTSM